MTRQGAEILLAGVILARSTSYLVTKNSLETMGTFNLLAMRFLLASALLLPLLWRRREKLSPRTARRGLILGAMFLGVMGAELTGLRTASTSMTSFLENTAIVFVPLFHAALTRRAPERHVLYGALTALAGVGLLTLGGGAGAPNAGMGWCLLAAVLYAAVILVTGRFSREEDPLLLGALQVLFLGLLAAAVSFLTETPRLPGGGEWGAVIWLAVVCTGFGFTFQPMAQSRITAERAGLFCALNPVSAAVLGRVFLRERLGLQGIFGAALILLSILVSKRGGELERPENPPVLPDTADCR